MTKARWIGSFLCGAAAAALLLLSWAFASGLAGVFVYNRF